MNVSLWPLVSLWSEFANHDVKSEAKKVQVLRDGKIKFYMQLIKFYDLMLHLKAFTERKSMIP